MSTRSEVIGKQVINGIDGVETTAHDAVHAGADSARHLTKAGSRWAARQENAAARKARMLKRRLDKQAVQLSKATGKTVDAVTDTAKGAVTASGRYVRKNPWPALAIVSGAALVLGTLLGRRRS